MGSKKAIDSYEERKPIDLEARENQLISLAMNLAEQKLRDGTASSQIIALYAKLGTTNARIEKKILENQSELIAAKTESIKSEARMEELYQNAISALRQYKGEKNVQDVQRIDEP